MLLKTEGGVTIDTEKVARVRQVPHVGSQGLRVHYRDGSTAVYEDPDGVLHEAFRKAGILAF